MEFDKVSIEFIKNLFEDDEEKKMTNLIFTKHDDLAIVDELIKLDKETKKND